LRIIAHTELSRLDSGRVLGGDWDLGTENFNIHPKYEIVYERFVKHKTWEEAGAYNLMKSLIKEESGAVDGCYSIEDIRFRYEEIDRIYANTKISGRLLTRQEISKKNFRELDGIYVHVDRNANFIFGGGGCHRFAIAKVLQLKYIPVQVGVVHEDAVPFWRKNCIKTTEYA
tara:strand:+ start:146 stop:661 length:516 start_codon:yes stop_codon:yes gene_type:complete